MNPKTQLTLYFLATLSGIGLFIFGLFENEMTPTWIDVMWGIYSLTFAFLTYKSWRKMQAD